MKKFLCGVPSEVDQSYLYRSSSLSNPTDIHMYSLLKDPCTRLRARTDDLHIH